MVNQLLQGVDADEAQEAAVELREYAALFSELSWTAGKGELALVKEANGSL
jgi:hypothetical protein